MLCEITLPTFFDVTQFICTGQQKLQLGNDITE